jgi:Sigma-70, region 4
MTYEEAELIGKMKTYLRTHPAAPDATATISDFYRTRRFDGIADRQRFLHQKKLIAEALAANGSLRAARIMHSRYNKTTTYWLMKEFWPTPAHMKTAQSDTSRRRDDFVLLLRQRGYTLQQIADRIAICRERVKQIEARAVRRRRSEWDQIGINLTIIERELKNPTKAISKVSGPLNDTGSDPTIASGGST